MPFWFVNDMQIFENIIYCCTFSSGLNRANYLTINEFSSRLLNQNVHKAIKFQSGTREVTEIIGNQKELTIFHIGKVQLMMIDRTS